MVAVRTRFDEFAEKVTEQDVAVEPGIAGVAQLGHARQHIRDRGGVDAHHHHRNQLGDELAGVAVEQALVIFDRRVHRRGETTPEDVDSRVGHSLRE